MNRKSKLTVLATFVILATLIGPLFFVQEAQAGVHQAAWYKTVEGKLDTDYYSLYPYETKSVDIGFSKYGELISYDPTTGAHQGLLYDDRDPFAPIIGMSKNSPSGWLEGWFIDIKYAHPTLGLREVWAFALFSDFMDHGNDWLHAPELDPAVPADLAKIPAWQEYPPYANPALPPYGGRKTNGAASSDDVVVLYNGPRRYVALLVTHVYDQKDSTRKHLVDVMITLIFNKDKKEVVLLKDIKLIDPEIQVKIQFSNRAKWHLGPAASYPQYAYFFHNQSTCYGADWHTHEILNEHTYDVAQIISADTPTPEYVGWMAFWPNLTDWDIDGKDNFLRPLTAVHTIDHWPEEINRYVRRDDMVSPPPTPEPDIPWVIGEWIFWLDSTRMQYRAVTVYGVTDYHDADDDDLHAFHPGNGTFCVIDREAKFQLDEIFNPTDLYNAVHKETWRWVEFATVPTTSISVGGYTGWPIATSAANVPVLVVSNDYWDAYCEFSERIIRLDTGALLHRLVDYVMLPVPTTGQALILFINSNLVGKDVKILYSTLPEITDTYTNVFVNATFSDYATPVPVTHTFLDGDTWTDILGVTHVIGISDAMSAWNFTELSDNYTLVDLEDASLVTDFKIPEGETKSKAMDVFYDANDTYLGLNGTLVFAHAIKAPDGCSVQMDQTGGIMMNHTVFFDNSTKTLNLTVTIGVSFTIHEKIMGRYEWAIVGRDAASVDSAGVAMVSEAFDSRKEIEVGKSGLDMEDTIWGPRVPFMTYEIRPGTGTVEVRPGAFQPSRANYRDAIFKSCSGRSRLQDDWCTTIPVASSNIITVGSPWANHLTEYFNEFTDAYLDVGYGEDGSVMGINPGYIVALTCWSKNTYMPDDPNGDGSFDDQTVGYAVISTYKDLNNTLGFVVWGWTGQDTFFACEWFWDEGITQLQTFPPCVTTIILEIDYTAHPPAVSVVECLGTISETLVHDVKGGIHPDP